MEIDFFDKKIVRTTILPIKFSFSEPELKNLCNNDFFMEALYLASPNLHCKIQDWLTKNTLEIDNKLMNSVLKYALRASNRPTPFGLFSGCFALNRKKSLLDITDFSIRRHTRMDMSFIHSISKYLIEIESIRDELVFFVNTSLYTYLNKIRYIESNFIGNKRNDKICEVEINDYLENILLLCKQGAYKKDIMEYLVNNGILHEEASNYVDELITSQILVSQLEPSIIGSDQLTHIYNVINSILNTSHSKKIAEITNLIEELLNSIAVIDNEPLAFKEHIDVYEKIFFKIRELGIVSDKSKLIQTDLYFDDIKKKTTSDNILSKNTLLKAIKVINQLSHNYENRNLKEFKEKFYERYKEQTVHISEVFDTDIGIGYSVNSNSTGNENSLIKGVPFPLNIPTNSSFPKTNVNKFLINILHQANQNKNIEYKIDPNSLKSIEPDWVNFPETTFCLVKEYRENNEIGAYIDVIGGASATTLIGRFGTGDTQISDIMDEIFHHEEQCLEDFVIASITHLPEARTGNILTRPKARKFEIPYLVRPYLEPDNRIDISDLYLCMRGEQLILFSKKLNKRIVPRLDNAHNYEYGSLPIYHFLCDFQLQYPQRLMNIDFTPFRDFFFFFPRLKVENIVISPAHWVFENQILDSIFKQNNWKISLEDFRKKWNIPEIALFVDGDNFIPIDFKNNLSLELLKTEYKKRQKIIFKEFEFYEHNSTISDSTGNQYANENIYLLKSNKEQSSFELKEIDYFKRELNQNKIYRVGSEWVYFKIYCGAKTAENLLSENLTKIVEQLTFDNVIDYWFFIRYADPDNHIRLRFHLTDSTKINNVITKVNEVLNELVEKRVIWRISLDQYERELERYGYELIEFCEKIFYIDSVNTIQFISLLEGEEGEELRWMFALSKINILLDTFSFSIEDKLDLCNNLKTSFNLEFKINKDVSKHINKTYQEKQILINKFLEFKIFEEEYFEDLKKIINDYKQENTILIQLYSHLINDTVPQKIKSITESIIHMMINRLFINNQRMHEVMIYNLLYKYYKSKIAQRLNIQK